jgi:uncharacterized protein (DUF58 family)
MLLAAWFGHIIITVILGLVMASAGFSRLFSGLSLVNVTCQQILNETRVFPGERIELKLQLSNRKLLPLPWVQLDIPLPLGFSPDVVSVPENRPGYGFLSRAAALLWYSKITWKVELECPKRGYYKIGPSRITSGDIFGFYPRTLEETSPDYLIVYPKIFPVEPGNILFLYPIGDSRAEKRIFDDPTRIMGVRNYNPHDSLRRIHWKATARRQILQVKVFEPTTTLDAVIFLAVDGFAEEGTPDDFERAISMAASLANRFMEAGNAVGLFVNTRLADSQQAVKILPGSSIYQLAIMLEMLAKTTRITKSPFENFLNEERRNLPWGATLIFVLYEVSVTTDRIVENLKESGYRVLIYQINTKHTSRSSESVAEHLTSESQGDGVPEHEN